LAAFGEVAALVRRAPGAGGVQGAAAMTGGVGERADDRDGGVAAGIAGGGRIKSPGAGALDGLVAHAGNHRLGGVSHRDFLAALGEVAALISGAPGAGGVQGAAAMSG